MKKLIKNYLGILSLIFILHTIIILRKRISAIIMEYKQNGMCDFHVNLDWKMHTPYKISVLKHFRVNFSINIEWIDTNVLNTIIQAWVRKEKGQIIIPERSERTVLWMTNIDQEMSFCLNESHTKIICSQTMAKKFMTCLVEKTFDYHMYQTKIIIKMSPQELTAQLEPSYMSLNSINTLIEHMEARTFYNWPVYQTNDDDLVIITEPQCVAMGSYNVIAILFGPEAIEYILGEFKKISQIAKQETSIDSQYDLAFI